LDLQALKRHINSKFLSFGFPCLLIPEHPLSNQVTFSHPLLDLALRSGELQGAVMKRVMDRPETSEVWNTEEEEQAVLEELKNL
jgi:hypothetical protein